MGLLPWSLGFSLIVAILCWSQFGRISEERMVHNAVIETLDGRATNFFAEIADASEELFRKICPDADADTNKPVKRQPHHGRNTPLTKKLHISTLVSSGGGEKQTQELLFRRLISILYGQQPLFDPDGKNDEAVQDLFDELFERIAEVETKFPIKKTEALGNIELTGSDQYTKEFIRFLLLKGGKGEVFSRCSCDLPPLGKYIDVRKRKQCMSVYLAPRELLLALFQNEETVENVMATRMEIFHALSKVYAENKTIDGREKLCAAKEELSAELKQFETSIPSDIDPNQIDFTVSLTRPQKRY